MLDPVLAQYLWHERNRKLTLDAERERQLRDGRQLSLTVSQRLRIWSGDTLIGFGYRLKRHTLLEDANAVGRPARWTSTATRAETGGIRPYTLIYSQALTVGAGRGAGVMLLSLTWLPAQQISARS